MMMGCNFQKIYARFGLNRRTERTEGSKLHPCEVDHSLLNYEKLNVPFLRNIFRFDQYYNFLFVTTMTLLIYTSVPFFGGRVKKERKKQERYSFVCLHKQHAMLHGILGRPLPRSTIVPSPVRL